MTLHGTTWTVTATILLATAAASAQAPSWHLVSFNKKASDCALQPLRATSDPQMLAILQQMAIAGAQQFDQHEVAAFLLRDANGVVSYVPWPQSGRFCSEHYQGTIPAGTVAIAHTHPWQTDQHPSLGDIEQARRIGIPIYVATRWNLYVVDSNGDVITLFARTDWTRSTRPAEALLARN